MKDDLETLSIAELMERSGVKFGTSGARGLTEAMTDRVCYAYTRAFLQYLQALGQLAMSSRVAVAGDLRPSTPRIMAAVCLAVRDSGFQPVNCGFIPSPAVALYGIQQDIPAIMVTGSHIPDDRNGIKFNKATGEILKTDEEGIRSQRVSFDRALFGPEGMVSEPADLPDIDEQAYLEYRERYLGFFPTQCLKGRRIGLYEHSSVARRPLADILAGLGADVVRLGYSEVFVPVDTEAVRPEDRVLARQWVAEHRLDALVSTDGDGDRPLISDEHGEWLRGDVAGILCARYLGARHIATPVSCNSAVEICGWFEGVDRTRIGSPYVIAAMMAALAEGRRGVVGYEANGGFLTGDLLERGGRGLSALPTRDAVIVILSVLMLSLEQGVSVSGLLHALPARYTASDRLKAFPGELSRRHIAELIQGVEGNSFDAIDDMFSDRFGKVSGLDQTDGLRMSFGSGEVVHLRPSGNAPELRCYTEADSDARAVEMTGICLKILEGWRDI